jgi:hypothetical protein
MTGVGIDPKGTLVHGNRESPVHTRHRMMIVLAGLLVGLVLAIRTDALRAYPEPSIVSKSWQLDFTYSDPRPIAVKNADGQTQWYWVMPYEVTNNTGEERVFAPDFLVTTEAGDLINAGRDIGGEAFAAIKEKLNDRHLEDPVRIVGKILQGEDYTKHGIAVWPVMDHDAVKMTLFISGLSGETATIPHPTEKNDKGQPKPVVLVKTLQLNYELPGTPKRPQDQTVVAAGKTWIMR